MPSTILLVMIIMVVNMVWNSGMLYGLYLVHQIILVLLQLWMMIGRHENMMRLILWHQIMHRRHCCKLSSSNSWYIRIRRCFGLICHVCSCGSWRVIRWMLHLAQMSGTLFEVVALVMIVGLRRFEHHLRSWWRRTARSKLVLVHFSAV